MNDLRGKTAVVTGGASGIGLGIAGALTGAGMRVAIADVEDTALERARASLAGSAGDVLAVRVDVTDREALAAAADRVEEAFGTVHVLCNNAGVLVGGSIDEMAYADWDWVLGVNVRGVINGLQTFLPRIAAHGEGGHIVNTASLAGMSTARGMSVYTASKFAVVGLTEALRADLADSGIGVSVLCPGVVDTNIFESGRNRPDAMRSETDTDVYPLVRHLPDEDRAARMDRVSPPPSIPRRSERSCCTASGRTRRSSSRTRTSSPWSSRATPPWRRRSSDGRATARSRGSETGFPARRVRAGPGRHGGRCLPESCRRPYRPSARDAR